MEVDPAGTVWLTVTTWVFVPETRVRLWPERRGTGVAATDKLV
jgi:hypothetical protein